VRVVVIGAGIVGAACAAEATAAGLDVTIVDRGPVGAGTTSRGEGNVLVSDKGPGLELDLARLSRTLWDHWADELGAARFEYESKGGLVVATTAAAHEALTAFAATQAAAGVVTEPAAALHDLEPHLADGLPGGVYYPEDAQVQPVLAAAALLGAARRRGARVVTGEVAGLDTGPAGQVRGIHLADGTAVPADAVVNAAGTWGGAVAARFGAPLEILPRRGFVLVTVPLTPRVHHKVYSADYVANVASSDEGLETSCVVEGTRGGTILIGASRERVGFDPTMSPPVVARLAAQACALFPFLADVRLLRTYRGFRPYSPDHLPVIGPDARVPGLLHACGHEGAGIGLAPATGALVTAYLLGHPWRGAEPSAYAGLSPDRFLVAAAEGQS